MSRVEYAKDAEVDLVGIAETIARDKPEAARGWVQRMREVCMTLGSQPEMGELRPGFGVPGCRSPSETTSFSIGQRETASKWLESCMAAGTCDSFRTPNGKHGRRRAGWQESA